MGGDDTEAKKRIKQLMDERGWTEYKLAKASGLSQSTVANIYRRNTEPTIATLEAICKGFGLTLSQFFDDGESSVLLTSEQKELFDIWVALSAEQKIALRELIKTMMNISMK